MPHPQTISLILANEFTSVLENILKTKGFDYLIVPAPIAGMQQIRLQINCEDSELAQFGFITGFQVAMTLQVEQGINIQI